MKILLTGCTGFIGSHTLDRLIANGHQIIGVDNFDSFYDRSLKTANIAAHANHPDFELLEADLTNSDTYQKLNFLVGDEPIDAIIRLAVKAGVRPSIENPVGKKAIIDRQPEQPGDVPKTWADVSKAKKLFGYKPTITFIDGATVFYSW